MSTPNNKKTLRELTTLEGGSNGDVSLFLERLGVAVESMSPRERAAYDVIALYRPARAKLRSQDPTVQAQGREEMLRFADSRISLADAAINAGDLVGGLNTLQQRASGLGLGGDQASQLLVLRQTWETLHHDFLEDLNDDVVFVRSSVFAGLTENDPEFAKTVTVDAHEAFVRATGERRDPNFAGRALVFARRLVIEGRRQDAIFFLQMAEESHPFSKEDQVRDARAYLAELQAADATA